MRGMSNRTGKPLDDEQHLSQSIADILTTPIGSRVGRRDYGSLLPELIDQPFNPLTKLRLFGAIATAISRWEPRIRLTRVSVEKGDLPGSFIFNLVGQRASQRRSGEYTRLTVPLTYRKP